MTFPTSLDSFTAPLVGQPRNTPGMDEVSTITSIQDSLVALEEKVGIDSSTNTNSLDYKIRQISPLTTKGDIVVHNGTNNTRLPVGTNGYVLVVDNTEPTGLKYSSPTSGGTVTSVSVVNSNGFTGSVGSATSTPSITLGTDITGIVKGSGSAFVPATEGADYYKPGATDVTVADGGTGVSSLTPYAPLFGGITSTGAIQSGSLGTVEQVLTSNGPGALPTFKNAIVGSATGPSTLPLPADVTTTNTTSYGSSVSFSGGVVYLSLYVLSRGLDQLATLKLQHSTDNSTWSDLYSVQAFAYSANSFQEAKTLVSARLIASGYLRTVLVSQGTSITTSISASGSYIHY